MEESRNRAMAEVVTRGGAARDSYKYFFDCMSSRAKKIHSYNMPSAQPCSGAPVGRAAWKEEARLVKGLEAYLIAGHGHGAYPR